MVNADLDGKVIIVTGGTQGLGEGIARHLAACRAAGITICGRNEGRGRHVAAALKEECGCTALYQKADLRDPEQCRQVVRACDERFGALHGLVNAAGVTTRGTLDDTSVALWDEIFAVNVRAPFVLMQESVRVMKRDRVPGSIVNILSMSAYGGQPFITAYCASKGALANLTKNVAHSLRLDRIRVNGLNIGWMSTPNEDAIQRGMGKPASWLDLAEPEQPFGRILRPADVAYLTAFLLGEQAEMMTGALIDVDQNVMGAYD